MPSPAENFIAEDASHAGKGLFLRFIPLIVVLTATALVFATGLHRQLTLEALVRHRMAIDALVYSHGLIALAAYVGLYIAVVALSIPGAAILTITGGLLFGTVVGAIAAICSATIGATIIFLIARTALGEWLRRRAGPRLAHLVAGFRDDAFNYLLFLRLIPLFPFWLVNLVAALAGVPLVPFIIATVLGIIPIALVGAFLGAGLDNILAEEIGAYNICQAVGRHDCRLDFDLSAAATPQVVAAIAALCLVALMPVIVRRIRGARH